MLVWITHLSVVFWALLLIHFGIKNDTRLIGDWYSRLLYNFLFLDIFVDSNLQNFTCLRNLLSYYISVLSCKLRLGLCKDFKECNCFWLDCHQIGNLPEGNSLSVIIEVVANLLDYQRICDLVHCSHLYPLANQVEDVFYLRSLDLVRFHRKADHLKHSVNFFGNRTAEAFSWLFLAAHNEGYDELMDARLVRINFLGDQLHDLFHFNRLER